MDNEKLKPNLIGGGGVQYGRTMDKSRTDRGII